MSVCLFCDETSLTREHIWPDWISRLFHPVKKARRYKVRSFGSNQTSREWHMPALEQKARVVCDVCNPGWMSDLEHIARPVLEPLLFGQPTALDFEAQATLTAWITLRAMIHEHTVPEENGRYYTLQERRHFSDPNTPIDAPHGMFIWLAEYRRQRYQRFRSEVHNLQITNPKHGQALHHVQITTCIVGRFVFQVVVGRWPIGMQLDLDFPAVLNWSSTTVQLWPCSYDTLRWPPSAYLVRETFQPFADRWMSGIRMTEIN